MPHRPTGDPLGNLGQKHPAGGREPSNIAERRTLVDAERRGQPPRPKHRAWRVTPATGGSVLVVTSGHEEDHRPAAGPAQRAPAFRGLSIVMRTRPFRRLWLTLGLSSLGDWLGLLATATFASAQLKAPAAQGFAFGSVIAVQLLPAIVLGPVSGLLAARFDRRYTMVIVDLIRFVLYASIPTVGLLVDQPGWVVGWAAIATLLAQAAALLWVPAKEAAVPNLVPRDQLETANQLTLATTYGIAPLLGALVLALAAKIPFPGGRQNSVDLALYFNAMTFLAAGLVVLFGIKEISGRAVRPKPVAGGAGVIRDAKEGWRYLTRTPLVRGLTYGILGAFSGAGVVVGTARFLAISLGGGDSTFATLFAVLFIGFGVGIVAGPRIVGQLSRRRWFGLSIMLGGVSILAVAVIPTLEPALVATAGAGAGAGMAFLSGITLLGNQVADDVRGRVFAFVQTAVRVTLVASIAVAGILVGLGSSRHIHVDGLAVDVSTTRVLLFVAGAASIWVGWKSLRTMDDRPGVPIIRDVWNTAALRRELRPPPDQDSSRDNDGEQRR
jgi:dTMP kinase